MHAFEKYQLLSRRPRRFLIKAGPFVVEMPCFALVRQWDFDPETLLPPTFLYIYSHFSVRDNQAIGDAFDLNCFNI